MSNLKNYYARIRVRGKLIWKSLNTDRISAAKLRLGDFHKEERQRASAQAAVARGKITFGDALAAYQQKLQNDPNIKPKTKEYCELRIKALLESWPELKGKDVSKISRAECEFSVLIFTSLIVCGPAAVCFPFLSTHHVPAVSALTSSGRC